MPMLRPQPSFANGFARSQGESAHPELWDRFAGAWPTALGVQGGSVFDASGQGDDGILTNMDPPTDWVVGERGLALNYGSAVDQFVNLGLWDGNGRVSFFSIIKPTNTGVIGAILSADSSTNVHRVFQFRRNSSDLLNFIIFVGGSVRQVIGGTTLTSGQTFSVGAVNDGTNMHVYVNGLSDATPVSSGEMDNDPAAFLIGARAPNVDLSVILEDFIGDIGTTYRWDRALSANEMALLHLKTLAPFELKRRPVAFVPAVSGVDIRSHIIPAYMMANA